MSGGSGTADSPSRAPMSPEVDVLPTGMGAAVLGQGERIGVRDRHRILSLDALIPVDVELDQVAVGIRDVEPLAHMVVECHVHGDVVGDKRVPRSRRPNTPE